MSLTVIRTLNPQLTATIVRILETPHCTTEPISAVNRQAA